MVILTTESKIDEKGRICIPVELRKKLDLKPGEKMIFQINGNNIIVRKAISPAEFVKKSEKFQKHIKETVKEEITIKKIFE